MEGFPDEAQVEGLGALRGADHTVVSGLTNHEVRRSERGLCKGFGPVGTGLLPAQQQESETVLPHRFEAAAGLVHSVNLTLGIAAPAAQHPVFQKTRRQVRRHGVHMRAEHHPGLTPAEQQVQAAVAHLEAAQLPALQFGGEHQRKLPLLSGSGVVFQHFAKKVHNTTKVYL